MSHPGGCGDLAVDAGFCSENRLARASSEARAGRTGQRRSRSRSLAWVTVTQPVASENPMPPVGPQRVQSRSRLAVMALSARTAPTSGAQSAASGAHLAW
jgi:hypothetical protein